MDGYRGVRFTVYDLRFAVRALYRLPHTLNRLPFPQTLIARGYTVPQLRFHRFEIQVAANADELITGGIWPLVVFQLKPSAGELEKVAGGAFFEPDNPFHTEQFWGEVIV